ncbi:MAG: hypothetical protein M3619_24245 [Myxococcota bacterium]|nr:hypothetical protein [Myxococcota bacterium]
MLKLLPFIEVNAGRFRVNQVTQPTKVTSDHAAGVKLVDTFADYEAHPREITLTTFQSMVTMHTRIPDLYNSPHDQLREQIRLAIEAIKEEKESQFINSASFGMLSVAAEKMRIQGSGDPLSPNDLDDLLSLVWNRPALFVAHPRAIACFHRECNNRGLDVETVEMFGVPFSTWRGVPIIPSDKLPLKTNKKQQTLSSVLLMRFGQQEQGVIGLHQAGVGTEALPSFSVRLMGIDTNSVARYLITSYFSAAVLAPTALGVIHDVGV